MITGTEVLNYEYQIFFNLCGWSWRWKIVWGGSHGYVSQKNKIKVKNVYMFHSIKASLRE